MSRRRWIPRCDGGRVLATRLGLCATVTLGGASAASAQRLSADTLHSTNPDQQLFRGRDITLLAGAFVISGEIAHYDTKIAHYTQSPSVQGDSGRLHLMKRLTKANETTLTAGALVGYGIGRLGHLPVVTDVSAHVGEALLITNVVSQIIRGPFGRARPYVTHDDQNSDFHVGKGFTSYDYRSLPSLHSASAFAAASALTAEINERRPGAAWPVGAVLYTAAAIPGLTRMYLDQHWASDVVMGGFLGAFIGYKVVVHAHANPRNRLDRLLLGTTVVPEGRGRFAVSWNAAVP
ncbi:MAG: phosphatase PAP2 family protein [bacterium]